MSVWSGSWTGIYCHADACPIFSPVSTAPSSEAKGIGFAPVAVYPDF